MRRQSALAIGAIAAALGHWAGQELLRGLPSFLRYLSLSYAAIVLLDGVTWLFEPTSRKWLYVDQYLEELLVAAGPVLLIAIGQRVAELYFGGHPLLPLAISPVPAVVYALYRRSGQKWD
ncbi:MAG: hypothetical protein AB1492_07040 [Bacillota bacterium]